ncbi:Transcription factor bHLH91 like [Actinidia chinensis var. chinensis]|uniref:Transcription factor bHLH91 like n=1 Tax=Actinidia chinensis var. chinensis TaxID=1590841 RepID=A0A2R6RAH9_ACTCC|nr:Transcription factor bHLH91 like [Actinidia chinensis var. chinensis]
MYEESECFDPNSMQGLSKDGFSQNPSFSMEEPSYHQNPSPESAAGGGAAATVEVELHQQMGLDMANMEPCYNINNSNSLIDSTYLMQEVVLDSNHVLPYDHSNWDPNLNHNHHQDLNHHVEIANGHYPNLISNNSSIPDLLNLLHLPTCSPSSVLPNSSLSFLSQAQKSTNFPPSFLGDFASNESGMVSNLVHDSLFHLNLPSRPPLLREMFQSLPNCSLFGGGGSGGVVDEKDGSEGGRQFDNGVLQFCREWDMNCMAKEGNGKGITTKHFATERQRREHLNGKFTALRSLVPNPTKTDRASIIGDAIEYIKELLRTVNELKILVEKKRCGKDRSKRHKTEEDGTTGDLENVNKKPDPDQSYNGPSLRSSWLQRKSKDTEVDVRIIDDEVTIKLAQRKKINCLLIVSKVIDELQLDIHHVTGGLVGDNYSFLFNSKICEGSSVYASAIANKLIEVVNRQYAAIPPSTSSY